MRFLGLITRGASGEAKIDIAERSTEASSMVFKQPVTSANLAGVSLLPVRTLFSRVAGSPFNPKVEPPQVIGGSRTILKIDKLYKRLIRKTPQVTRASARTDVRVPAPRKYVVRRAHPRIQTVSEHASFHGVKRCAHRDDKNYFRGVSLHYEVDPSQGAFLTTTQPKSPDAELQHFYRKLICFRGVHLYCIELRIATRQGLDESKSPGTTICVANWRTYPLPLVDNMCIARKPVWP